MAVIVGIGRRGQSRGENITWGYQDGTRMGDEMFLSAVPAGKAVTGVSLSTWSVPSGDLSQKLNECWRTK